MHYAAPGTVHVVLEQIADSSPEVATAGPASVAIEATGRAKSAREGSFGGDRESGQATVVIALFVLPSPSLLSQMKPLASRRAAPCPASCRRPFSSLARTVFASHL